MCASSVMLLENQYLKITFLTANSCRGPKDKILAFRRPHFRIFHLITMLASYHENCQNFFQEITSHKSFECAVLEF